MLSAFTGMTEDFALRSLTTICCCWNVFSSFSFCHKAYACARDVLYMLLFMLYT